MVNALTELGATSTTSATRAVRSAAEHSAVWRMRGRGEVAIEGDEAAILRALGSAITERRTELGMSQRGLATEAGLDRVFLRGIEDGTRKATVITLIRLATALDTTAADLLANC